MNRFIRFIARRIAFQITTFIIFLLVIFALPRVIPGNPLAVILNQIFQEARATPELVSTVEKMLMEEFGLGKPMHIQFYEFVSRLLKGDLGTSIAFYPRKVAEQEDRRR